MTTARSPLNQLKRQADMIAQTLKAAERGEAPALPNIDKFIAARARPGVKFAVVMDDKTLIIEMEWSLIEASSEAGISEFILKQMREARDAVH
jgi:predicted peroxiredoxin